MNVYMVYVYDVHKTVYKSYKSTCAPGRSVIYCFVELAVLFPNILSTMPRIILA